MTLWGMPAIRIAELISLIADALVTIQDLRRAGCPERKADQGMH